LSTPSTEDANNDDATTNVPGTVVDFKTLKEKPPFTRFFRGRMADMYSAEDHSVTKTENVATVTYAPQCFEVITDYMHLYPLWSAALQGDSGNDQCGRRCLTDALVESHFKSVKHGRLQGRADIRVEQDEKKTDAVGEGQSKATVGAACITGKVVKKTTPDVLQILPLQHVLGRTYT